MIRRRGQAFTKAEREAILATYDTNLNLNATARVHGISAAGVLKLVRQRRDGGPPSAGGPAGPLRRKLAAMPLAFPPDAKKPEKAATTQPAPALSLLPSPVSPPVAPTGLTRPSNPIPPTQSESKTRASSWELVGSLALASRAVLSLMHQELASTLPDGRALNEFASILQKLHISYGITVEKARLLHNESTGIIAKVEDLSKLPEGVTLDVAIAFVRGTIHGKLPA